MRLLLDTHALYWLWLAPDRIPAATLGRVRDPSVEVFVSAITPFEFATKERLGKLPRARPMILAYPDFLRRFGAIELPVSSRHAIIAGSLSWDNRDPFDRILAAQGIVEGLPLVTADASFSALGAAQIDWE